MFAVLAKKMFGTTNDRLLNKYRSQIDLIQSFAEPLKQLKDSELKSKTKYFKQLLAQGKTLDELLPEAYAVVREASTRVLGQRHYDVQLLGGIILHQGMIAEMKTGEGKTLVATLPSYLNALSGEGVHVVTANDYLAKRDAEWMGKIHNFLGLTVGVIHHGKNDIQRKEAYSADITYCTNNELGFDYLRDHMKYSTAEQVLRPFYFALIDEVDLVLIDEARTPLIISGSVQESTEIYGKIDKIAVKINPEYTEVDEKAKSINLNEQGIEFAERLCIDAGLIAPGQSLYDLDNVQVLHHLNQAMKAHNLMQRDTDYIIREGEVVIIDEFTGRMMEGRRFGEGLHQAIEAKEQVKINNENQTLASITFQNLFRSYPRLAGMAGTAMTEAAEFEEIYKLKVAEVPTNIPVARIDAEDEIFATIQEKNNAIVMAITEAHNKGQPVLVGTVSIEKSEVLSKLLKKSKIPHNVLNAKFHEQEAYIIAQAGKIGAVTIATNMAGRGTDIKLGGNVEMLVEQNKKAKMTVAELNKLRAKIDKDVEQSKQKVLAAGGLMVIGTERHESRRIDNQLRGRSGRQGDAGFTRFYLSLEDDLMRIFGSDNISSMLAKLGLKDGEAIQHPWISKAIAKAQGKVEARNFEMRKTLIKYDDVTNQQRQVIYEQRQDIMSATDLTIMIENITADHIPQLVNHYLDQNNAITEERFAALESHLQQSLQVSLKLIGKDTATINNEIVEAIKNHLTQKQKNHSAKVFDNVSKYLALVTLDQLWKDHLLQLDHLRSGVGLRSYGQKDPLNEYKREAFELFGLLLDRYKEILLERLSKFELHDNSKTDVDSFYARAKAADHSQLRQTKQDVNQLAASKSQNATIRTRSKKNDEIDINNPETWGRVGRNDLCPCGSGKKYKHCHGKIS